VGERLRASASAAGQWKLRDMLPEPQGAYARALLGEANPAATWSATIRLIQEPPVVVQAPPKTSTDTNAFAVRVPGWFSSSSPQFFWDNAPRLSVRLELVLRERDAIRPAFARTLHFDLLSEQVGFRPVQLSEATRNAMQQQLNAERERRAWVTKAEGERQAQQLKADGELYTAQKQAEARRILAEADAFATQTVGAAIMTNGQAAIDFEIMKQQVISIAELGKSPNTKLVVVPTDITKALGGLTALFEGLKK
jgi:hypothetical protein